MSWRFLHTDMLLSSWLKNLNLNSPRNSPTSCGHLLLFSFSFFSKNLEVRLDQGFLLFLSRRPIYEYKIHYKLTSVADFDIHCLRERIMTKKLLEDSVILWNKFTFMSQRKFSISSRKTSKMLFTLPKIIGGIWSHPWSPSYPEVVFYSQFIRSLHLSKQF